MVINRLIQKYRHPLDIAFRDITSFGGIIFYFLFVVGVLLIPEYGLALRLVLGLAAIFVIIVLIRSFYHRDRPIKQEYGNFAEKIDASSFPSMHTARAVFFSLTLITFFEYQILAVLFFVGLAVLTSISRIYLKKHDWWDLLGGLVLGVLTWLVILNI